MNRIYRIILIGALMGVSLRWLDLHDYYLSNYLKLSEEDNERFEWKDNYSDLDHRKIYENHFGDERFMFPRQKVSKVKMLERDKFVNAFWVSKTLKEERVGDVVGLFNSPYNFDWSETTWGEGDVDYIFKFYDSQDRLVGKIEICYHDCGMIRSIPFTPNIKYGQLSASGNEELFLLLYKLDCWE